MGLRLANEHLDRARAALEAALAEIDAASHNLAKKKRSRLLQSSAILRVEIATVDEVSHKISQKREQKQFARLAASNTDDGLSENDEDALWADDEDVIAEIFAEAQERHSAADNSRDSLGEEPPSWHDALRRIEEQ
jgi:hypothetical protein